MFQYISLARDKAWKPGPYPGVELLVLHTSEETGGVTILRKFHAGTAKARSEAWQAGLDRKPTRKLPENARHYLSTHCKKMTVRQEGLVLNVGKNRLLFYSEETAKLIGCEVLAYYSLECPELLTVSDLNRQNYFAVKAISLPAISATKEQFREVHTLISGHTKAAREIYGGIEHPRIANITRDTMATEETAALGEFHNDRVAQFKQEQAAETRVLREIQLAAPGRAIPANVPPARFLQGIKLENAGREDLAAAPCDAPEIPAPSDSGDKEYILKTAPVAAPTVKQYFALWAQVEKAKPALSRHALTQKALGIHPHVKHMTPAQLAKMISVFSAILRDATKVTA